jgi:hypothetical protein
MPTPPFSQHRRDWLDEISGLFKASKKEKTLRSPNRIDIAREGSIKSTFSYGSSSGSSFVSTSTTKED